MPDELLFYKADMFGVVQAQTEAVKKRIQSVPANKLLNASEQDLVDAAVEEFRMNVPVIKQDDIYIAEAGEMQVDVSRDPMRRFLLDHHSVSRFTTRQNQGTAPTSNIFVRTTRPYIAGLNPPV